MFIGIPIGMDPAPFWAYLFLYFFEMQYVKNNFSCITKSTQISYPGTVKFIDELCAIINGNELFKFQSIYPKELELRVKHSGRYATFLDLDITIKDKTFIYKHFDEI